MLCPSLQATYISWVNQLQANITRMRSAEAAAAAAAANSSSGLGVVAAAPADLPFSRLFSDWVAANTPSWQPQQVPVANALMTINVQVSGGPLTLMTLCYSRHDRQCEADKRSSCRAGPA